jgi:hypothetical protein
VAAGNRTGYFGQIPAPIYVSTNAGATWIKTSAPSNNWFSVACSADGAKLVAVAAPLGNIGDGRIYTSPDLGATWSPTSAPSNNWTSVACSADGTKLVAVAAPRPVWNGTNYDYVGGGAIYSSSDAGASWMRTSALSNFWCAVASSADGAKFVAAAGGSDNTGRFYTGMIYASTNSGVTWTATGAPSNNWTSVASSADGTNIGGRFYG